MYLCMIGVSVSQWEQLPAGIRTRVFYLLCCQVAADSIYNPRSVAGFHASRGMDCGCNVGSIEATC